MNLPLDDRSRERATTTLSRQTPHLKCCPNARASSLRDIGTFVKRGWPTLVFLTRRSRSADSQAACAAITLRGCDHRGRVIDSRRVGRRSDRSRHDSRRNDGIELLLSSQANIVATLDKSAQMHPVLGDADINATAGSTQPCTVAILQPQPGRARREIPDGLERMNACRQAVSATT